MNTLLEHYELLIYIHLTSSNEWYEPYPLKPSLTWNLKKILCDG